MAIDQNNLNMLNEQLEEMRKRLDKTTTSLGSTRKVVNQLDKDLAAITNSVKKWAAQISGPLVAAFGLKEIINQFGQLARASTEYMKVAASLENSITDVTKGIGKLKDASVYYSDIAGAKIIATLLSQSQALRQNMNDVTGLAKDLKQLYLTTEDATQAAVKYSGILSRMPRFISAIRSEAVKASEVLGMLLSADSMGVDPTGMLEAIQEQLALGIEDDLTTFTGASRVLVREWNNFKESLIDVTLILARALGNEQFVKSLVKALHTLVELALRFAKNVADFINAQDWNKITQVLDVWIDKFKVVGKWLVDHWKLVVGLIGAWKILGGVAGAFGGGLAAGAGRAVGGMIGGGGAGGAGGLGGAAVGGIAKVAAGLSPAAIQGIITATVLTGGVLAAVVTAVGLYIGTGAAGAVGQEARKAREMGMQSGGWWSDRLEGIKGAFGGQTRARTYIEAEAAKASTPEEARAGLAQMRAEKGGTPKELAVRAQMAERQAQAEKALAKARAEALMAAQRAYYMIVEQVRQTEAMLQMLQSQKNLLEINYDISKDLALSFNGMRTATHGQVQNLEKQVRNTDYLMSLSQQRLASMRQQLAHEDDALEAARIQAGMAKESANLISLQVNKERMRLEQIQLIVKNITDELALRREIIGVAVDTIKAQMDINKAISSGMQLTTQQRGQYLNQLQAGLDLEKQSLAAARARAESEIDPERRRRLTLDLQKQEVDLTSRQAEIIRARVQEVEEYYSSFAKYAQTAMQSYQSQYEYQEKINAGLSFSTQERITNVRAQERMLNLEIQRSQQQVVLARQQSQITGDIEPLRVAQETLNALLGERVSMMDRELNALSSYYDQLSRALGANLGIAEANLDLMEKANLGLGVNIQQRMQVYALEKQTIDARQAELDRRQQIISTFADERVRREAMIKLQEDQANLTRDQAALIDKMKISMEDYLDAFSAASAGSAEAFSKVLDPLQDADRLMQQFSGGVGSLARGMTGGNMAREMQSAAMGNVRAQFQVGGFARQQQLAGGGAYVPAEMMSVGAALGTAAASGPMVGGQYWGQDLTGAGLTPGGPGMQGMGPVASNLFPGGVMPGQQIYGNMGSPTQYGYGAIAGAVGRNANLQGANPISLGAEVMRGGASGGMSTLVFHIYGNRGDIESKVINVIRENFNPGGAPTSRGR